MLVLISYLGK